MSHLKFIKILIQ